MARVVRHRTAIQQYRLPANSGKWSSEAARVGKAAIAAAAPRETGFLKSGIRTSSYPGTIGPTVRYEGVADYTIYQEVGTGLRGPLKRWITPKRAAMLSWIDSQTGDRRFAKRVRGVWPRRFFRKGLEATFGRRRVRYYGWRRGANVER